MARAEPHKAGESPRGPTADAMATSAAPPPVPLYHHPVVALSIVFVVACLAQIVVWQAGARLSANGTPPSPSPTVHGHLFRVCQEQLTEALPGERAESALFIATLSASMLSAVGWYAVARLGIGPAWGLWTALLWVVHPSFAFLAQRNDALALLILLAPAVLALLLWWRKSKRPTPALLAGMALGLLALTGLQGLVALPLALAALLLAPVKRLTQLSSAILVCLGFGLVLAAASTVLRPPFHLSTVMDRLGEDGPLILKDGRSPVAVAARRELAARPSEPAIASAQFLLRQLRRSPKDTLQWLGRRLWRSTYSTCGHRFERPVFAAEMLFLVPATWGLLVALRFRPWRWMAVACGLLVAAFWLAAGLIEPLARNLAPVGGVPILFALIGVADVYERLFGRRLTGENP